MATTQFNASNGLLLDGVTLKDGTVDVNGTADALILDADGDTTIGASTDDVIDVKVAGAVDFQILANELKVLAGSKISAHTATFCVPFMSTNAQQALSGAGAVAVTNYYTAWTTTGANAGTLADGTVIGQLKKIQLVTDAGDGTLTPSNLSGGTTITFADAGDYVVLMWTGTAWSAIELGNSADGRTAPVIA
jgi:hypothetical protein